MKFSVDNLYIITSLACCKANACATWRKCCRPVDGDSDPAQAGCRGDHTMTDQPKSRGALLFELPAVRRAAETRDEHGRRPPLLRCRERGFFSAPLLCFDLGGLALVPWRASQALRQSQE
jgi:hypothetical protein